MKSLKKTLCDRTRLLVVVVVVVGGRRVRGPLRYHQQQQRPAGFVSTARLRTPLGRRTARYVDCPSMDNIDEICYQSPLPYNVTVYEF
jgi:hypothetical protein